MFDFTKLNRSVEVISPFNLYKWNRHYLKLQSNFFIEKFKFLREKQIQDFVYLNDFDRVYIIKDTDIFKDGFKAQTVETMNQANLVIVTDQNFSRYPCPEILKQIQKIIKVCPNLYLCLNRHYINIDNSYHDNSLSDEWQLAITQWLKKGLPEMSVLDLSFTWDDRGDYLSWSIPDRHYYISKK